MIRKLALTLTAGLIATGGSYGMEGTSQAEGTVTFKDNLPSWAKADINYVAFKGYMKGDQNGTFNPNATISRAEFAAILARASNNPEDSTKTGFNNISGWSQNEVNMAVSKGFISTTDYPNGFNPNMPLTRRELAKWVASGLATKEADFKQALSDTADTLVPVAEYYKGGLNKSDYPYVSVAMGTGLMTGYPNGTFGPSQTTTRAEAAVILHRFESIQDKKPSAFQDLKEFREVGLTGTNVISMGYFFRKDEHDNETTFTKIRNVPYNLRNNIGKISLDHYIIANVSGLNNIRNLYGKMFVDKNYSYTSWINANNYLVFVEYSFTPNVTNIDANTYLNSSNIGELHLPGFKSGTVSKFGLNVLPEYGMISDMNFFKKGITNKFWVANYINKQYVEDSLRNGVIISLNDKTFSIYIPE
ncbi:hypothetical protein J2Z69_002428 [Paenibacillus shirakamiensis]|uniref:SLH domain-containing protein n=1 Tax=Paenibacillus shirakamiensis TaxID=1265935 RepID=A0ABS4JJU9_9BACL|nr:S-layer homology domain-containing protein [Paenibacillus shirakamiensis]MBP2001385.1 hypothetical protein [Paenibacillus shirakamiensis]